MGWIEDYDEFLNQQVWSDIAGASTRDHPAPFPAALADRLIRMFSTTGMVDAPQPAGNLQDTDHLPVSVRSAR